MTIDIKALQDDLRKLAIALFITAFIGFFLKEQNFWHVSYAIFSGLLLWVLGLTRIGEK
ncbi:MAG: hypothetical protein Ctma_0467 [Catillopecten margaritatus gill symbiont]|uniref:Uncharacterized protein n=1 Tax=Catillopecten margaritatus gill symbiont TaxID=3083288 RepID=A0AAU6PFK6_9GAMM